MQNNKEGEGKILCDRNVSANKIKYRNASINKPKKILEVN